MESSSTARRCQEPWNKGKLVGQKLPLKLRETLNKLPTSLS